MRTTNPLILILILVAVTLVVAARKPQAPWGRSFEFFVRLAVFIFAVRVLLQILVGASFGTTEVLWLPALPLPEWFAGVRLGGPVMLESVLIGVYDGLRLATLVIIFGAANSLASPTRMLKSVPAVLYEFGVSVVIALSFTPQLVADVQRVRTARRMRGRPSSGIRGIASAAIPVFESALERSITLAAAMDARGYGRRTTNPHQRLASLLLLVAVIAAVIGTYGLVADRTTFIIGAPMIVVALTVGGLSLFLAGKNSIRTHYRKDPWSIPEWLIGACGLGVAALFTAAAWQGVGDLNPSTVPPRWPGLPAFIWLAIALAVAPAYIAPPVPIDESASPLAIPAEVRRPDVAGARQ
jgi:energy-coupling factor transport system permease protein